MADNVTPIRDHRPAVNDIPGQLRRMAEDIEAGKITAEQLIVLIPNDGFYPQIFGWGESMGLSERLGMLDLAHAWILANQVQDEE